MKKSLKILFVLCPLSLLIVVGCAGTRAGYSSAPYKTVRSDGKFDLREYPSLVLAETGMGEASNEDNGSFGRLFRFISGGNAEKAKISMTTPVFMAGDEKKRTMAFVMPSEMEADGVPAPSDAGVRIREFEAGRFAAFRFSGGRNGAREARALGELRAWMEREGYGAKDDAVYGYFDPPWTPAFLRRNEVMLRVAP
jgi:hypothetical protein